MSEPTTRPGALVMPRRVLVGLLVLIGAVTLLPACNTTPNFEMGYAVPQAAPATNDLELLVLPFEDRRQPKGRDKAGQLFILYLPLLPWWTLEYDRVDEIVADLSFGAPPTPTSRLEGLEFEAGDLHFTRSMARSVAYDVRRSGLAAGVDYARTAPVDGDHDYVLTGVLNRTQVRQASTSYMLGMGGVLLWLLPIPMSKAAGICDLTLQIKDAESGDLLWEARALGEHDSLRTLYGTVPVKYGGNSAFAFQIYKGSDDEFVHANSIFWWNAMALRDAMEQLRPQLREALDALGRGEPAPFTP